MANGVTLSRTVIPVVPPNYLQRKHLYPLLEGAPSSSTLIVAPTGYGKTALVAEWAKTKKNLIWLTISQNDTLSEMSALFIQATRNLLPGFAPWFERDQPLRPTEIVRRWGNELLETGGDYIFVLDNLRDNFSKDVDIASELIEQFPSNLHFIAMRRNAYEGSYGIMSSRGPLKVIDANTLKFTNEEIISLAHSRNILDESAIEEVEAKSQRWPIVVSMLLDKYSHSGAIPDFQYLTSSESEPLSHLAIEMLETLDSESLEILTSLSAVSEFDQELAEVILENQRSIEVIERLATEGNFLSRTGLFGEIFTFSPLMRQAFYLRLKKSAKLKDRIDRALMKHFEKNGSVNRALEFALHIRDEEKIRELYPNTIRMYQATGRGSEIIRLSKIAGSSANDGALKQATVEITGHITSGDYLKAISVIEQTRLSMRGSTIEGFLEQLLAGSECIISFTFARFEDFDASYKKVMVEQDGKYAFSVDDLIFVMRLAAARAFILDKTDEVESISLKVQELAQETNLAHTKIFTLSIRAMELWQRGECRRAYETSLIAIEAHQNAGLVGHMGPLDAMYVQAKCLIDFARPREALEVFRQLREKALEWKQWTWFYLANDYLARDLILRKQYQQARDFIKEQREFLKEIKVANNLSALANFPEIYLLYTLRDWEKLKWAIEDTIENTFTRQVRNFMADKIGSVDSEKIARELPERTPREQIYKYLSQTDLVLDQETLALAELRKALAVGASVGAMEIFLRQNDKFANLIFKIAAETPTNYLEELATLLTERIKMQEARPDSVASNLTKRELEILRHLSTDRPISAIAASLHISINTIKTHLKNLYRKMDVDGRESAVAKAKELYLL